MNNEMMLLLACKEIKSAVKYLSPTNRIKITKLSNVRRGLDARLTIGKPNYAERKFVKLCLKAGEKFPIRKLQITKWRKKCLLVKK